MKKMSCLLVTFLLCVGSAYAEFDSMGAGSDAMCFTGRSDVFTYYSLNRISTIAILWMCVMTGALCS